MAERRTALDRINGAISRRGLTRDDAHADPVRGNDTLVVIDMRYGYHVCEDHEAVAAFFERLPIDPSPKNLVDTINRGLDPYLVDYAVRDRVRWTATGGMGPAHYAYR